MCPIIALLDHSFFCLVPISMELIPVDFAKFMLGIKRLNPWLQEKVFPLDSLVAVTHITHILWYMSSSVWFVQHVGCTIRPIKTRMGEHFCDTTNYNVKQMSSVLRHFRGTWQAFNFTVLKKSLNPSQGHRGRFP